jgi:hypothetical protein
VDKLINRMKELTEDLIQPTLFERDYSELIKVCKEFLEKKGYKTVRCHYTFPKINKSTDLIDLFDALFMRHHPDLLAPYRKQSISRSIAKRFVDSRIKAGSLSKEQALLECAEIINTIFRHEDEFNFTMPLSFGMLGQENCGWITDKAIQIMNRKKAKEDEIRAEIAQEMCAKEYIKTHGEKGLGFDLDKILERMEKTKEEHLNG